MLLFLLLALPFALRAEWQEFRSGPLSVVTDAGPRIGRATLIHFEQLRHSLGLVLAKPDMDAPWPIRIVVFKDAKEHTRYHAADRFSPARDALTAALSAKDPIPRELVRDAARIFIEANTQSRMPPGFEAALALLYSTLEVNVTRVQLGAPVPEPERTRDWARLHLLSTSPAYSGKLRVLLANLQQGAEREPAYKNAFERTPDEIEAELDRYIAAGEFSPAPVSGKPISPQGIRARPVASALAKVWTADLLLADPGRAAEARSAYQDILNSDEGTPEAHEALGLLAAREGHADDARRELTLAVEGNKASARGLLALAKLTEDPAQAIRYLEAAASKNPLWPEPYLEMAQREEHLGKRHALLTKAATLARRNASFWRSVAEVAQEANQFGEAAKAWTAAERAAATGEEREELRRARLDIERQKADFAEAERLRAAREREEELQRLKDELEARVRAAEQQANAGKSSTPPREIVPWWDGPPLSKLTGILLRVECQSGGSARLVVDADGKTVRYLVRKPSEIVIMGGGERALGCGPQRPPQRVRVEYQAAPNATAHAGEVVLIEFLGN